MGGHSALDTVSRFGKPSAHTLSRWGGTRPAGGRGSGGEKASPPPAAARHARRRRRTSARAVGAAGSSATTGAAGRERAVVHTDAAPPAGHRRRLGIMRHTPENSPGEAGGAEESRPTRNAGGRTPAA